MLTAVQARLARRQLPRVTSEGLVDYSLQIPASASTAARSDWKPQKGGSGGFKWGSDVDWIRAGKMTTKKAIYFDETSSESDNTSRRPSLTKSTLPPVKY